jgi:hypothetical protein
LQRLQKELQDETIPRYVVLEQIRSNKSTRTLTQLSELEERLVALRLTFLQIKEMGHRYRKPQLGLTGGVINVPTSTYRIQFGQPRNIKDIDIVEIVIKKSLRFKIIYAIGQIQIHTDHKALKYLCKTMIYKLENVKIDDNWK